MQPLLQLTLAPLCEMPQAPDCTGTPDPGGGGARPCHPAHLNPLPTHAAPGADVHRWVQGIGDGAPAELGVQWCLISAKSGAGAASQGSHGH